MNIRVSWAVLSLLVLISYSCGDDVTEAVPDTEPPEITVISHSDGDPLRSNPTIQLDVKDESDIEKVICYIDGLSIGGNDGPPFESIWYTGYWDPGNWYELHVSAEDAAGNTGNSEILSLFVREDAQIIPQPYQPEDSTYFAAWTTLTFACEPCPGADQYTLWWR